MKKLITILSIGAFLFTSCKKESTADYTPLNNDAAGSNASSLKAVTGNNELQPTGVSFIYKVPDPNNIFEKQKIYLRSYAPGAVSYAWNFGNGTKSTLANPVIDYIMHGYYNITLTVTYGDGRTASATNEILILCNFLGH
ncbi:MAG: PKD domain-containing protein [Ferruginibacter sp.]|nr:PKD domain-containing protein [Ferruginibacter sp.]